MKTLVARLLPFVLLMGFLSATPSFAAEDWPAAPTPNWASTSVIQGIRLGQWLPCDPTWKSTTDCIQSLKWTKLDGSKSGLATFVPNSSFDPFTAVQVWEGATDLNGNRVDNYGHFLNTRVGTWTLPDGFTNSDGSKSIYVEAHLMAGGLQFRVTADNNSNLPVDASAEITLKSANYAKFAGWIFGNTKSPSVAVSDGLVTITGNPVITPYAAAADPDICHSNTKKAAGSNSVIQISLSLRAPNEVIEAGDAILGTNGNGCFSGVSFDSTSQQIVVGIGNTHFDENGNAIQGWFNLMVRGSRAKQWWGIEPSSAADSIQVQVVYEDGTSVVASTEAKYDPVKDVIAFQSQGFHFSTPTLRVGLKKTVPVVEPVVVNPVIVVPTVATVKKTTITCVKGKTSKKVTAAKPKCPNGYKEK